MGYWRLRFQLVCTRSSAELLELVRIPKEGLRKGCIELLVRFWILNGLLHVLSTAADHQLIRALGFYRDGQPEDTPVLVVASACNRGQIGINILQDKFEILHRSDYRAQHILLVRYVENARLNAAQLRLGRIGFHYHFLPG